MEQQCKQVLQHDAAAVVLRAAGRSIAAAETAEGQAVITPTHRHRTTAATAAGDVPDLRPPGL